MSASLETAQAQDRNERLGFVQQPGPEDFRYQVVYLAAASEAGRLVRANMEFAVEAAEATLGIRFTRAEASAAPDSPASPDPAVRPLYTMLGPANLSDPDSLAATARQSRLIARGQPDVRTNVANWYDTGTPPDAARLNALGKTAVCNVIFADEPHDGFRVVTAADLLDNVICETVRVKYQARRDHRHEARVRLDAALPAITPTVHEISCLFRDHVLFHRDSTDGAIVVNHDDNTLASQTKTNKLLMTPEDFSLVTSFDAARNTVDFAGRKLPSSDAPELLRLMERLRTAGLPIPRLLIHFHHSTLTRSGQFPANETVEEIEYGKFASGDQLFDELQAKQTNWLLLKNHGFLWLGETTAEFREFIDSLRGDE